MTETEEEKERTQKKDNLESKRTTKTLIFPRRRIAGGTLSHIHSLLIGRQSQIFLSFVLSLV